MTTTDVPFAADVVEHADVGMVEARERPALRARTARERRARHDVRRQDLDRDRAIEAGVACAVDLAHAARADGRLDDVGTEAGSGGADSSEVADQHHVTRALTFGEKQAFAVRRVFQAVDRPAGELRQLLRGTAGDGCSQNCPRRPW